VDTNCIILFHYIMLKLISREIKESKIKIYGTTNVVTYVRSTILKLAAIPTEQA
jgi:hypothetical protein